MEVGAMSDRKPFAEIGEGYGSYAASVMVCGYRIPFMYDDLVGTCAAKINAAVERERRAERERCARIVESYANTDPERAIAAAAAEIRGGK